MPEKSKVDVEKAPFYKRWWFWLVVVVIVIAGIVGAGGSETGNDDVDSPAVDSSASSSPSATAQENETSQEDQIEDVIRGRIGDKFTMTTVDSITINENARGDAADSYIVLVNLMWSQENTADTSKSMLSMYSEDLAAYVAEECPNVDEIAVFWEVPYLKANAKVTYERKGQGMALADQSWIGFK